MPDDLRALQARFYDLVTAMARSDAASRWSSPEDSTTATGRTAQLTRVAGERAAHDVATLPLTSWLAGGDEAFARARLDVYVDGYIYRLIDTLRDAYPKVEALVGERFPIVVAEYLGRHPPTSPSLRYVGDLFPRFIAEHEIALRYPWAGELARLEHARVDVFDQANDRPLELADLANLAASAPEDWATRRFVAGPWVRVLRLDHPVDRVWRALEDEVEVPTITPSPTAVLVWRRDFFVYHRAVPEPDATALERLVRGETFAEICAAFVETEEVDRTAERAFIALRQWLADGHVKAVR